jgi:hypothetical protein
MSFNPAVLLAVIFACSASALAQEALLDKIPTGTGHLIRVSTDSPPANDARKHYLIALEALKNNDLPIALTELNQAAALAPDNALIWYNIAIVESRKGEPKAALDHLHKAEGLGLPASRKNEVEELNATLAYQLKKEGAKASHASNPQSTWLECSGQYQYQVITGSENVVHDENNHDVSWVFEWTPSKNRIQSYNPNSQTLSSATVAADGTVANVSSQMITLIDSTDAPPPVLNDSLHSDQWLAQYHYFTAINRVTLTFILNEDKVWNWKKQSLRNIRGQEAHARAELPCKVIKPLPIQAPKL